MWRAGHPLPGLPGTLAQLYITFYNSELLIYYHNNHDNNNNNNNNNNFILISHAAPTDRYVLYYVLWSRQGGVGGVWGVWERVCSVCSARTRCLLDRPSLSLGRDRFKDTVVGYPGPGRGSKITHYFSCYLLAISFSQ